MLNMNFQYLGYKVNANCQYLARIKGKFMNCQYLGYKVNGVRIL